MKTYIWYLPGVVFLIWMVIWETRHRRWLRDTTIVRNPRNHLWHPFRFLDDAQWTDKGLRMRSQYGRHVGIGLLLTFAAAALAKFLEARL